MKIIFWALSVLAMAATSCCAPSRSAEEVVRPSEYVSTLVGTQSDYSLSAGNTTEKRPSGANRRAACCSSSP